MTTTQYLALLRGINVGGSNIIKMTALKTCFEEMGFANVLTYIQSGNVIFDAPKQDIAALTQKIERVLSKKFNYTSQIVLVSQKDLATVVKNAPPKFGADSARYRYDVLFLKPPLTAREALKVVSLKEGVDFVHAGKGVLYFSRLISKATQSKLSKIVLLPIYKSITIRNWNTTTKLAALVDARSQSKNKG